MNQQQLAERLGVTFQQVQKYENAGNRISASRLQAAATALGVSIDYFFAGLERSAVEESAEEKQLRERLQQPGTLDLVRFFYEVLDERVRVHFLDLVKAIGDDH